MPNRSDVLIVLPSGVLGGAERVLLTLASFLLEAGNCVTVYIMSRGSQPGWGHLEGRKNFNLIVREFKSERASIFSFFLSVYRLSRSKKFEYVISSHVHVNAALSLMRKFGVLKCRWLIGRESTSVLNRFSGAKKGVFLFFYRFCYGAHDLLICQTEGMRRSIVSEIPRGLAKEVLVIPNPVDLSNIERMLRIGGSFHSHDGEARIVACGRLIPLKGFLALVDAFHMVLKTHPHARLYILGDGPQRAELEKKIALLKIESSAFLMGKLENPMRFFDSADLGIISSEIEGFPNVLLEMMAAGAKHVITTPCTDGVNEIPNVDVLSGFSANEMARAMDSSLVEALDLRATYREYVEKNRSVEAFWRVASEALRRG